MGKVCKGGFLDIMINVGGQIVDTGGRAVVPPRQSQPCRWLADAAGGTLIKVAMTDLPEEPGVVTAVRTERLHAQSHCEYLRVVRDHSKEWRCYTGQAEPFETLLRR